MINLYGVINRKYIVGKV